MVDRFDVPSSDPDFQIHLKIDSDLQNASRITQEYLKAQPHRASIVKSMGVFHPNITLQVERKDFFPQLFAATDRSGWLMPLVRRFVWHQTHPEPEALWLLLITGMIGHALDVTREVNEPRFLELAEPAQALMTMHCANFSLKMGRYLHGLEKPGLSADVIRAAQRLWSLEETHREWFGWPLFRSQAGLAAIDFGWSTQVHSDLFAMEKKRRDLWLRVIADMAHWVNGLNRKQSRLWFERLNPAEVEQTLRRWIGFLGQAEELELSKIGEMLLPHVIALCEHLDGAACDDLLYRIATAKWKKIGPWLMYYAGFNNGGVLERRPLDRRFACLEALMMNPVAAKDRHVQLQYEGLATTMGVRELPTARLGADGFPLETDPALAPHQMRIDQLLQMGAASVAKGHWENGEFRASPEAYTAFQTMREAIVAEFSSDPAALHRAATIRHEWIAAHHDEFSKELRSVWWQLFMALDCAGGLIERSVSEVGELCLEDLLRSLRSGARKSFEMCQTYVAEHGWCAELVEALGEFMPQLGAGNSDQYLRIQAHWLLWFEDVAPIRLEDCWSYRIRRDLRTMPSGERGAWLALIANTSLMATAKPPGKWMKAAEAAFRKIRPEDFRRRFVEWFQPFDSGPPLRLSVAGRVVLRTLIWYALIAKDPVVDKALIGFASAEWKTKEFLRRAAQAEAAFGYVLSERAPQAVLPILENLVANGRAFEGSATHRLYLELCVRRNHTPVPAIPGDRTMEEEPASPPSPVIDKPAVSGPQPLVKQ